MLRIISLVAVVLLSGCASYGSPKYGCSGLPEGTTCMATRDIYGVTEGGSSVRGGTTEVVDKNKRDNDSSDEKEKVDVGREKVSTDAVIDTFVTPNLPDRPIPIRTPAQVMRIWVASWEDTNTGALIVPGYVYTEIEPRRWVIGRPDSAATQQGRLFQPLRSQQNTINQIKE